MSDIKADSYCYECGRGFSAADRHCSACGAIRRVRAVTLAPPAINHAKAIDTAFDYLRLADHKEAGEYFNKSNLLNLARAYLALPQPDVTAKTEGAGE